MNPLTVSCCDCQMGNQHLCKVAGTVFFQCDETDCWAIAGLFPDGLSLSPRSLEDQVMKNHGAWSAALSSRFVPVARRPVILSEYASQDSSDPTMLSHTGRGDRVVVDRTGENVLAQIPMLRVSVQCPRCLQGWVDRREFSGTGQPFWLCDECDGVWFGNHIHWRCTSTLTRYVETSLGPFVETSTGRLSFHHLELSRLTRVPRASEYLEITWADGSVNRFGDAAALP